MAAGGHEECVSTHALGVLAALGGATRQGRGVRRAAERFWPEPLPDWSTRQMWGGLLL